MIENRMRPIHPGEILREEFLLPMGITANSLAMALMIPAPRINDIARERRGITADTALRLGILFGMEPRFWLNLQAEYDMRTVTRNLLGKISPRIRVFHQVAV